MLMIQMLMVRADCGSVPVLPAGELREWESYYD